jgi:hypothetical protein
MSEIPVPPHEHRCWCLPEGSEGIPASRHVLQPRHRNPSLCCLLWDTRHSSSAPSSSSAGHSASPNVATCGAASKKRDTGGAALPRQVPACARAGAVPGMLRSDRAPAAADPHPLSCSCRNPIPAIRTLLPGDIVTASRAHACGGFPEIMKYRAVYPRSVASCPVVSPEVAGSSSVTVSCAMSAAPDSAKDPG